VIQIDGLHVGDHVLVAAIGIDGAGDKHVLALALGATENAAVVKALLADLIERGLQPDIARLFIVDGAKALSRAVRDTFGGFALIQRCQVHYADLRIMPTNPAKPAWEAVIAAKDAA
jgi:putative transposase